MIGRFFCSRAGAASSLSPPPPPADGAGCSLQARKEGYADLVNTYYNLATDFYEIGWGQSFHFANKFAGETFALPAPIAAVSGSGSGGGGRS